MPMVNIRIVGMRMSEYRMAMRMRVRLLAVPWEVMGMLVVSVVHMPVAMVQRLMRVLVLMAFAAITAVSTPSTFNSSDAEAPLVCVRPSMSSAGPSTPPKMMAPSSQGTSLLGIFRSWTPPPASPRFAWRSSNSRQRPRPLPK